MEATQLKKELRLGANVSGILLVLFYVLVYAGTGLLYVLMQQFGNPDIGTMRDVYFFLSYTFQYVITVPVLLLVFRLACGKKTGQKLRDCICKPRVPVLTMLRWVLICIGITYASAYISRFFWMILQVLTGLELVAQNFAADNSLLSMLTNILAMVCYAPLLEEVLFRGTIFRSMQKGGDMAGALLCGLMFGLWHINYDQMIYAAVMGFCACVLLIKTGSLIAPFLLHITMNLIGAVQSLFVGSIDLDAVSQMEETQMVEYIFEHLTPFVMLILSSLLVIGLMGLGLILLIIEQFKYRQLFRFEKQEGDLPLGEKLVTCLTAPGMLIGCLAMVVLTVLRAMGIL